MYFSINNSFLYTSPIIGNFDFYDDILGVCILYVTLSIMNEIILNRKLSISDYPKKISLSFHNVSSRIENNFIVKNIITFIWPIYIIFSLLIQIPIFQIISLMHNFFSAGVIFLPFLKKTNQFIFWLGLIGALPISLIYGARGYILYPIVFYLIGMILFSKRPIRLGLKLTLVLLPILFASSIFAVARYALRGDELIYIDAFLLLLKASINLINDNSSNIIFSINTLCERIIQWPVLIGIDLNNFMDGRGYIDLIEEIYYALITSNISNNPLEVQEDIINSGFLYGGVKYLGYKVSVGWTVPLNLIADGIIRGGILGSIIYFFIFLTIVRLIECVAVKLNDNISSYIFAFIPGLILIKMPETHSILILKNIMYFLIFISGLIIIYKFFNKEIVKRKE